MYEYIAHNNVQIEISIYLYTYFMFFVNLMIVYRAERCR